MNSEIIIALCSLLGSACATLFGIISNAKLTNYRLKMLEAKVDKHNSVIERTFKIEKNCAVKEEIIHELSDEVKSIKKVLKHNGK